MPIFSNFSKLTVQEMERQLDGVDFDLFPYIVQLTLRTVAGIFFSKSVVFVATRGCKRLGMTRQKFPMPIIREFPCRDFCYDFASQCPFSLRSSDDFKRSPSEFIVVSKGPWQHQHVSLNICAAVSLWFIIASETHLKGRRDVVCALSESAVSLGLHLPTHIEVS